MKTNRWVSFVALLATVACGAQPPSQTPPSRPPVVTTTSDVRTVATVIYADAHPVVGATCQLEDVPPVTRHEGTTNIDGYVAWNGVSAGLRETAVHCQNPPAHVNLDQSAALKTGGNEELPVFTMVDNEPPPPGRADALNVHITFQGLMVHTNQYGTLPWFEAALSWLDDPADRAAVYAAKHASTAWPGGDTHAIIFIPSGPPLYDEPNQPYSGDRFGPRDWTTGGVMNPMFVELVKEVRHNGFIPLVFLGGDGTAGHPVAMAQIKMVYDALAAASPRDLRGDVIPLPGWDGVFYGWEPSHTLIPDWVNYARSLCSFCLIGLEHGTGHIPLGEGDSDWVPGGLLQNLDLLLSEFNDNQWDDTVWQISARLLGPAYTRDPEQSPADDPNAPFAADAGQFYLRHPTPRGPRGVCAFEFKEYTFVRDQDVAAVEKNRARFKARGWSCGG